MAENPQSVKKMGVTGRVFATSGNERREGTVGSTALCRRLGSEGFDGAARHIRLAAAFEK